MRFVRGFILSATIAIALFAAGAARAQQMSVASSSGPVEILRGEGDRWVPLTTQKTLAVGDLIRTGTGGNARLLLDDGSSVVLASGGLLRLDQLERREERYRILLRLLGGQVRATAAPIYPSEGRFEVETPTAVVSVHGTEFIVTYNTDTAETEVICVEGTVEVLGVLGVLGKPVILRAGEGTVVRKGAFPGPPSPVSEGRISSLVDVERSAVSFEDGLMASFTGIDSAAVLNPPEPPPAVAAQTGAGPRRSLRTVHKPVSVDAEIIDQSIQEYTLTPPGQTPPGEVSVIVR
jgi:hypothetical protein